MFNNIASSYLKVDDESLSSIRFRNTVKGGLPHLSYIFFNPEPLGKEFNTVACYVTGGFLFIEIHRGKEGTKKRKYHLELGEMAGCTKRVME